MKRFGYLWDYFCSVENAEMSIILATEHKRQNHAVRRKLCYTKREIKARPALRGQLDQAKVYELAVKIADMLKSDTWRPGLYKHIRIHNKSSGKTREIDCPPLIDHIVHWMLIRAIIKPLMRGMYKYCCGSIPRRGVECVRKTVERWLLDKQSKYFVKLDIRKFYPSIDRDRLKLALRRTIKDKHMLRMIDMIIDTAPSSRGLPIGAYTSPWLANYYLQPLDYFILQNNYKIRRGKRVNYATHYIRQTDDMLIIGTSKRDIEKLVRNIITFVRENLGLEIKTCWEIKRICNPAQDVKIGDYIDYAGYRFRRGETIMRKRIFLHAKRTAKHIYRRGVTLRGAQVMESLLGWCSHADNLNFRRKYIDPYINEKELKEVISLESKKRRPAI